MFLACAACATEVVVNHAPFLPIWGVCCLIWLASSFESTGIFAGRARLRGLRTEGVNAKSPLVVFGVIGLVGVALAASPLSVLVLALAVLAWPLWLGASAMRRVDSRGWLAAVVLVVPLALWIWNTPGMLVQRLGSGRMAEDASYEIMRRANAGEDMMPYLLQGLQGDGHYWIQSSAAQRQANIFALLPLFHDSIVIPTVKKTMEGGDVLIADPGIACLGSVGGQDAALAIVDYAAGHQYATKSAVDALRHLTGKDFGEDWPRWRTLLRAHPLNVSSQP